VIDAHADDSRSQTPFLVSPQPLSGGCAPACDRETGAC